MGLITRQTVMDLAVAYREIESCEKLLTDLANEMAHGETILLKDSFGRKRGLELGVPSGANSHRILDVAPPLAISIIKAHLAQQHAKLEAACEAARAELGLS